VKRLLQSYEDTSKNRWESGWTFSRCYADGLLSPKVCKTHISGHLPGPSKGLLSMHSSVFPSKRSGRATLSGEIGGRGLKKVTTVGMMCLCNKNIKSRWMRRSNFARMRRVLQEAKGNRAISVSMIANGSAIAVECANKRLAKGVERWWRACANQRSSL
jgi:hypothetical protein